MLIYDTIILKINNGAVSMSELVFEKRNFTRDLDYTYSL